MNTNHNLFELNNNLIDNNCSDTSKLQITATTTTTATSQEVQNIISIQNN